MSELETLGWSRSERAIYGKSGERARNSCRTPRRLAVAARSTRASRPLLGPSFRGEDRAPRPLLRRLPHHPSLQQQLRPPRLPLLHRLPARRPSLSLPSPRCLASPLHPGAPARVRRRVRAPPRAGRLPSRGPAPAAAAATRRRDAAPSASRSERQPTSHRRQRTTASRSSPTTTRRSRRLLGYRRPCGGGWQRPCLRPAATSCLASWCSTS